MCWEEDPELRPSFCQLVNVFTTLLESTQVSFYHRSVNRRKIMKETANIYIYIYIYIERERERERERES